MLRALVVLLFVANVLALAWHQGWIPGGAPAASRLDQQIHPEQLKVLGQQAAAPLAAKTSCVELGPLDGADAAAQATAALGKAGLPSSAWHTDTTSSSGLWGLATIKMPSKDFQARKEETYRTGRIAFEPLQGFPDEQPTLLLSRHESEAAAQAALDAMTKRAYKGLRILRLRAPAEQTTLRLARLDGSQLAHLDAVANPPWGANRKSCDAPAEASAPASAASAAAAPASAAATRPAAAPASSRR